MSKIDKKTIAIAVLLVCLIGAGWILFRSNVQNDGSGIDEIRDNISRVEDQQRGAINRIESVENGLTDSAKRLDAVQNGIKNTEKDLGSIAGGIEQSAERVTSDAERIAEGERILEGIRKRSQEDGK